MGSYTGTVAQTHPAGYSDEKNRRKRKPHKHLKNTVTEDKRVKKQVRGERGEKINKSRTGTGKMG